MKSYLIRRLLVMIPTFLGISIITFAVIQLAPGSPLTMKLQSEGGMRSDAANKEIIEQTKKLYGLDQPLPVRYLLWMKRLVTFDFGNSYKDHRPVLEKIGEALPITLQLNLMSLIIAYILAIPIGVYSATRPYTLTDSSITLVLFILYSIPSFWAATMLMMLLAGGDFWNIFPSHGIQSIGAENWPWYRQLADRLWHYALPVTCYTYASLAGISRYMRTSLLETIRQDYIRTARAFGFKERTIVYRHAMRNSLIPIVTLIGGMLPTLIGGSVIIEQIFSIPGMGRLAFEAMLSRDYPLIMGIFTITAMLTMLGLLLSDILSAWLNPRISFS
jgi:peptide/nickel transport system permease protein